MMWQLPFLSSHAPLKQKGDSSNLSLFFNCKNLAVDKGLVKTSATWSIEGTKRISNVFCKTLSRTKCMSISICFVREWYTWLAASEAAPWLSYQITGENLSSTPNYLCKECIQVNSVSFFSYNVWPYIIKINLKIISIYQQALNNNYCISILHKKKKMTCGIIKRPNTELESL